ncbi:hypothetical protein IK110_00585 [Candidatus Saccharibacteria bacterium]|nr:hypothetical protein [Candidatus Saccharibacteria bacterium]
MELEQNPIVPQPTQPERQASNRPNQLLTQDEIQDTAAKIEAEKKEEPEYPTTAGRFATYFLVLLAVVAVAAVTIAVIVSAS